MFRALVALVAVAPWFAATAQPKPMTIDVNRGQQVASQICAGCHGADGNSGSPVNPKLSAQHADYLYKQLVNFRPKAEGKEPERPNPIMTGIASTMTEEDMRNVSAFYATQGLKPAFAKSKDTAELGQKIYRGGIGEKNVPACAGCHGPTGLGIPSQYPRLSGQFGEYTEAQLVAFRQGARRNSSQMTTIAARMSDREIKAVADYIAGLR